MAGGTARFFSFKTALVAGGLLIAGLALGGYCALRVVNQGRISVMGFLLAAGLVLGAVAALTQAFPKGCRACQKPFTEGGSNFEPQIYDALVAALGQANPSALMAFVSAPRAGWQRYASLRFAYCDVCKQIGEASVHEEEQKADHTTKSLRQTPRTALSPPLLSAVLELTARRG
jgi:hypothetical protein